MGTPAVDNNALETGFSEQSLSKDEAFALLADGDRRAALACLLEHESGLTVDELVEAVVEATRPASTDDARLRDRLRIRFYHNHLPKLEDADVIDYYRATEIVEPNSATYAFEPVFERTDYL